jgi:hypothetical protein
LVARPSGPDHVQLKTAQSSQLRLMSKLDNPYTALPSNPPASVAATQAPLPLLHKAGSSLTDHGEVVYPYYGEEQPPGFMPYEAESFTTGDGDVVSHDPHLNEDGSSLETNI